MVDYLRSLAEESQQFADAASHANLTETVPTCPDWTMADLVWHLAEVQHFWASIVEGPLLEPDLVPDLERPDPSLLPGLFNEQAARLHRVLAATDPDTACWTWHQPDQSVGFVRRRQAHEALIHRVDAELCIGRPTPVDAELAADGVAEILDVMIDGIPAWGTFTPDGTTAEIRETDSGQTWRLHFGRFTGTSPITNTTYDLDALRVGDAHTATPNVRVRGRAPDLDLWLWGRATAKRLHIDGDVALARRLRQIAAESTT